MFRHNQREVGCQKAQTIRCHYLTLNWSLQWTWSRNEPKVELANCLSHDLSCQHRNVGHHQMIQKMILMKNRIQRRDQEGLRRSYCLDETCGE